MSRERMNVDWELVDRVSDLNPFLTRYKNYLVDMKTLTLRIHEGKGGRVGTVYIIIAKNILQHKDICTTLRYAHVSDKTEREKYEKCLTL